ncbi:aminotransferase class V-fold PLP-dependent enzyme [bacterium]|nr:aminotransferase class V-fold PLP-dependent enzyme [bacterium]
MRPAVSPLSVHWGLEPGVVFLNHGSFGACPTVVLDAQRAYRDRLESNPVEFLARLLPEMLAGVRTVLAGAVGGDPDRIVLVPNATTGVNTVLRSLEFDRGDQILMTPYTYRACANAVRHIASNTGADVVVAPLGAVVGSDEEAVASILGAVTSRTVVAVIDHITSPTATMLPIRAIAEALTDRGVAMVIDGAHGPGMLKLDLETLPVLAYVGNCHKWLMSPKGAGFIHADTDFLPDLMPLVVSHGWDPGPPSVERSMAMFDWTGTGDPTPHLAIADSVRFIEDVLGGMTAMMDANRSLAIAAARVIEQQTGLARCAPDSMTGSIAAFVLPGAPADTVDRAVPDPLQGRLMEGWGIEVLVIPWPETATRFIRISAQAYNTIEQYDYLARALLAEGAL